MCVLTIARNPHCACFRFYSGARLNVHTEASAYVFFQDLLYQLNEEYRRFFGSTAFEEATACVMYHEKTCFCEQYCNTDAIDGDDLARLYENSDEKSLRMTVKNKIPKLELMATDKTTVAGLEAALELTHSHTEALVTFDPEVKADEKEYDLLRNPTFPMFQSVAPIMMLHCNRVDEKKLGGKLRTFKNSDPVAFPMEIDMGKWVDSDQPPLDKKLSPKGLRYVLVGIIVHRGIDLESSHFYSLQRIRKKFGVVTDKDSWVQVFDEKVRQLDHERTKKLIKVLQSGFNLAKIVKENCKKKCRPLDCECKKARLHESTDVPQFLIYERAEYNMQDAHNWPCKQKYNHPNTDESTTVDRQGNLVVRQVTSQNPWQNQPVVEPGTGDGQDEQFATLNRHETFSTPAPPSKDSKDSVAPGGGPPPGGGGSQGFPSEEFRPSSGSGEYATLTTHSEAVEYSYDTIHEDHSSARDGFSESEYETRRASIVSIVDDDDGESAWAAMPTRRRAGAGAGAALL